MEQGADEARSGWSLAWMGVGVQGYKGVRVQVGGGIWGLGLVGVGLDAYFHYPISWLNACPCSSPVRFNILKTKGRGSEDVIEGTNVYLVVRDRIGTSF